MGSRIRARSFFSSSLSAISLAVSIFTLTLASTSVAAENTTARVTPVSASISFSAPFDLIASRPSTSGAAQEPQKTYEPPFDFPGALDTCTECQLSTAPFVL